MIIHSEFGYSQYLERRPTSTTAVDDETIAKYHSKRLEQLERDNFTIINEYETVRSGADKLKYGLQEDDERSYGITLNLVEARLSLQFGERERSGQKRQRSF